MPATDTPSQVKLLPARRPDLVFRPVGDDGHYVVKDPRTGAYFKLGPQESFLFRYLDGRHDAGSACRAFSRHFGEPLDGEGLHEFLTLAEESGLLAPPRAEPPPEARRRSEPVPAAATPRPPVHDPDVAAMKHAAPTAATAPAPVVRPVDPPRPVGAQGPAAPAKQSILYWRFRVFDPDALFNRLEPGLRFLWTRGFVVVSAAAIVAALVTSWLNRREMVGDFPLAWVARGEVLALAWLTLVAATTLHEFAHGLTCKHFGGEVHEVGFLLMFFLPCFYCNVSDAWLFREKSRRLWVTLAGGWCDLCLWAMAVFVWRLTLPDTLPHYLAWLLMGVAGARVFFNFNPLLKLDGYYLLSDAVEVPNLRARAIDRFMASARWLLWGGPRPAGEPRGRLLFWFGLATWAYSGLFLGLMVAGFMHWWGQSWGAAGAVAALALGLMTGAPMVRGLGQGEVSRMLASRKGRALAWAVCLAGLGVAACVVPVSDRASGPFRLRAATRAEIRAPVAGFLREVNFDEGQAVAAGAVVVRMDVPDLDSRIAQLEAQRAQAEAQLASLRAGERADRGTDEGEGDYWRIRAGEAQVARLREEQAYLQEQRRRLPVESPVAGMLTTPRLREKVGQYFHEGELICEVEDTALLEAEVAVPEQETANVRPGQRVELKARVAPFETLTAEVVRVASALKDPAPLPGAVGAAPAAAAVPSAIGEVPGHVVVYCAVAPPPSAGAAAAVRPGMTGYARIDCGAKPVGKVLGLRLMRYVRTEFWW